MLKERHLREKEFFNKTYSEHSRKNLKRIYSIAQLSNNFYMKYLCSISRDKNLLKLGCGLGNRSFQLVQCGAYVTGIDISNVAINRAKQRAKDEDVEKERFNFVVMNAEELEFSKNSFDVICGIGVLHHLDLKKIYLEIVRTLKPGGKAVFIEPLGHNPIINLFRRLTPKIRTEHEHPLVTKDIKLANNYFNKTELYHFHLLTFFAVPFRNFSCFRGLLNILAKTDKILFTIIPILKRYSWIVILVLKK